MTPKQFLCSLRTHIINEIAVLLFQVVELEVFMTPAMEEIYQAISELMDACIKELRKSNKIDTSELTVENGIFRSFDDIIRRQLDSIWHTVSPRTKQA